MDRISIEGLREKDTADLQSLAKTVGWNFTTGQAELFLSSMGTVLGYRHEGKLIASAGIYIYGSKLASLGIVIVHADFHRQGLGKRIVQQCLEEAERIHVPVMLVATKQGFPLYESLGFRTIGHIHRFEADSVSLGDIGARRQNASTLEESELENVVRLDETVFGADRHDVYKALFGNMHAGIVIRDERGAVCGFALSVRRSDLLVIGPVIAEDEETAMHLVQSLCVDWNGRVRVDVPSEQNSFMTRLSKSGVSPTMISPTMVLGATHLPGRRNCLFGIADPVFG